MSSSKVYVRQGQTDSSAVDIEKPVESVAEAATGAGVEPVIETTPVYGSDALAEEAFMRDILEIALMEPGNESDPSTVEVTVNGDRRLFFRDGSPAQARRYHVAVLAQAKQSRVRQKKIVNPDGSMGFVDENVLSPTYPFSVLMDPNPRKGVPWLRSMLKSPV